MLTNAVDQARREMDNRHDLRGTNAAIEREDLVIKVKAANELQFKQVVDILRPRQAARGIDLRAMELGSSGSVGSVCHIYGIDVY